MIYKYDLFYKPKFLQEIADQIGLTRARNLPKSVVFESKETLTKVEQHIYARHYVEKAVNTLVGNIFNLDLSSSTNLKFINNSKYDPVISLKRDTKVSEVDISNLHQVELTPLIQYMRMYVYRNEDTKEIESYEIDISFPSPPFMKTDSPEDDERLFYSMDLKGKYQRNVSDLKRVPYILKLYEPILQAFYRHCVAMEEDASGRAIYPDISKLFKHLFSAEKSSNTAEYLDAWVKENAVDNG